MTVIERWTIEGAAPDTRALINVAGPMIPPHAQRGMVLESDYEALAEQLAGAVEDRDALVHAMRAILAVDGHDLHPRVERIARAAINNHAGGQSA